MIEVIFILVVALVVVGSGYSIGKSVGTDALNRAKAELVTERAVRHNLNCLVYDLRHERERLDGLLHDQNVTAFELREEGAKYRADALAFKSLKGKWVTDNRSIIQHNTRKECFRRIGFPEHRL